MYYIISFKLDLKHTLNNNTILILNTIFINIQMLYIQYLQISSTWFPIILSI